MSYQLWHGDKINDNGLWCPVCLDLSYENFESSKIKESRLSGKASPHRLYKGALPAFDLWWRARRDFKHRAEQYNCGFCAALLQIIDVFWRGPADHFLLHRGARLETCIREHKNCGRESPLLPTRVLDLGDIGSDVAQPMKIVEMHPGTVGKYVALSYCWGDGNRFRATRSNISELLQGIDEEELPATIRDAIEVTRYLGLRYLWIDALCIIQDDMQDWIRESAQMATVYGEAYLTISASSVASSRMSFLHASRENGEYLFRLDNSKCYGGYNASEEATAQSQVLGVRRTVRSGFHQDPDRAIVDPGMCRAWMLQEYLLSPRVVSFSTDEVQWMCRTIRACECGNPEELDTPRLDTLQEKIKKVQEIGEQTKPGGNDGDDGDIGLAGSNLMIHCYNFWDDIVGAYCRRELTWVRDKLPALSGVAHEFARSIYEGRHSDMAPTRPSRYLAGLWEGDIHRGLCWVGANHPDCAPAEYCAPSWSWASVKGEVITSGRSPLNGIVLKAEVLEAACAVAHPDDPFGQVVPEGTHLRVRGPVVETKMKLTRRSPRWATEFPTPYGIISMDCGVETVDLGGNDATSEQQNATAGAPANMNNLEAPDLGSARTVRRRREQSAASADDDLERISSSGDSDFESDAGSKEAERPRKWRDISQWERDNLGKQFTVWLLHILDKEQEGGVEREVLAFGRPTGDPHEVYERIGIMRISPYQEQDNTAFDGYLQWPEQDEGLIRTITII
ncbi:hypothetical protein SLS62_008404 [Diatrype stigma]|uniref:Heterokaryon incompatibility domain-containing protein n=1 Tax=Diatrype stigma TaxID=117547 RepID=A0AAN9YNQ8_9PEZI